MSEWLAQRNFSEIACLILVVGAVVWALIRAFKGYDD